MDLSVVRSSLAGCAAAGKRKGGAKVGGETPEKDQKKRRKKKKKKARAKLGDAHGELANSLQRALLCFALIQ